MSIQLSKAELVLKVVFCAGDEIFRKFEYSSPLCLQPDYFLQAAFKRMIGIDQVIIGARRRALRTNSSDKDVNSQFPVFLVGGSC
jgi:hypothetical protein